MAPLSNEIRPVTSCLPPHLGPPIPEVNSIWFKLFIYQTIGHGPPTLLISKGSRMRCLPKILQGFERLLVTTWGHDPGVVPTSNALLTLNDALTHSAVLVQGYGRRYDGETVFVPFPFNSSRESSIISHMLQHPAVVKLSSIVDLEHYCGYITMLRDFEGSYSRHAGDTLQPDALTNDAPYAPQDEMESTGTAESSSVSSDVAASEPQDGITSKKAAEILISELDKLTTTTASPLHNSAAIADVLGPGNIEYDDWTLLDCYFGLPLFDCELNRDISRRISQHNLCKPDSLRALTHSSRILTIQLLEFISSMQDSAIFTDTRCETMTTTKRSDCDIISPCKNLIFDGTKLEVWSGR